MRVNAAVFEKLFTPLSVAEVEIDAPRPGEVLASSRSSG
jgi:Zn-dependent alcohol dehydrogenase